MDIKIDDLTATSSAIDGLKIIGSKMVTDNRGTVRELYRKSSIQICCQIH